MNTKSRLLELLEANRGKSVSGEEVARLLGVSRAAVWKAAKSLEQDGYAINAATNRGYCLSVESDILSVQGISPYLSETSYAEKIHVFQTLESTNKTAKEMAISGSEHGTVIIADNQTAGRGRYSRQFFCIRGSGLYISFVLNARKLNLPSVTMVTAVSAVAVCRAIKAVTGKETGIKWVNDILLNGRKVCGILSEGITDFESGGIEWVVTGIGVNISTEGFPVELQDVAGAICPIGKGGAVRNHLAAELINALLDEDIWKDIDRTRGEYKIRLVMLGEEISVFSQEEMFEATAVGLDEMCRLIVRKQDGSEVVLSSGEVSVKLKCKP